MASGKDGDFARLLDDLFQSAVVPDTEGGDEPAAAAPTIPFDYLSVVEELHSGRIKMSGEGAAEYRTMSAAVEEALRELDMQRAQVVPPPLQPEPLPSIEPLDIARELALDGLKRPDDLARARRGFAFDNHPDRVAPHLRDRAIIRMQVANMLVDEALRRLKR